MHSAPHGFVALGSSGDCSDRAVRCPLVVLSVPALISTNHPLLSAIGGIGVLSQSMLSVRLYRSREAASVRSRFVKTRKSSTMGNIKYRLAVSVFIPVAGWCVLGSDLLRPAASRLAHDGISLAAAEDPFRAVIAYRAGESVGDRAASAAAAAPADIAERIAAFHASALTEHRQIIPASIEMVDGDRASGGPPTGTGPGRLRWLLPPAHSMQIVAGHTANLLDAERTPLVPLPEDQLAEMDECAIDSNAQGAHDSADKTLENLTSVLIKSGEVAEVQVTAAPQVANADAAGNQAEHTAIGDANHHAPAAPTVTGDTIVPHSVLQAADGPETPTLHPEVRRLVAADTADTGSGLPDTPPLFSAAAPPTFDSGPDLEPATSGHSDVSDHAQPESHWPDTQESLDPSTILNPFVTFASQPTLSSSAATSRSTPPADKSVIPSPTEQGTEDPFRLAINELRRPKNANLLDQLLAQGDRPRDELKEQDDSDGSGGDSPAVEREFGGRSEEGSSGQLSTADRRVATARPKTQTTGPVFPDSEPPQSTLPPSDTASTWDLTVPANSDSDRLAPAAGESRDTWERTSKFAGYGPGSESPEVGRRAATENSLTSAARGTPAVSAADVAGDHAEPQGGVSVGSEQGDSTVTAADRSGKGPVIDPTTERDLDHDQLVWRRTTLPAPRDALPAMDPARSPDRRLVISDSAQRNAERAVQLGISLAERRAYYSARANFIQSLRSVAQSLDENAHNSQHSEALTQGLRAIQEAADFAPQVDVAYEETNLPLVISSHRTQLLKDADAKQLTSGQCLQEYLAYGETQIAQAVEGQPVASAAIYGLGRLQTALQEEHPEPTTTIRELRAMALYQAALIVDARNFRAANELGVLLARHGKFDDAVRALQLSVRVFPQVTTWHNLAAIHQRNGDHERARLALQEASKISPRQNEIEDQNTASASPDGIQWVSPDQFNRVGSDVPQLARSGAAGPAATGPSPMKESRPQVKPSPWRPLSFEPNPMSNKPRSFGFGMR